MLTSGGGIDWAHAAERREGGLGSWSVRIVAGRHQQSVCRIWTHPVSRKQAWCSPGQQRRQVGIELEELSRKGCPAPASSFSVTRAAVNGSLGAPRRDTRVVATSTCGLSAHSGSRRFVRGSIQYSPQLVGGLGACLDRGTAGSAQHSDRLDRTVTLLGYPECLISEHRSGRSLSIARVTLAGATSPLPRHRELAGCGCPKYLDTR